MRLLGALLLVSSLAHAHSRIVIDTQPGSEVAFARQVLPASGAPEGAVAQSRIIYLDHTGAHLRPGDTDARTNTSSIVGEPTQMPGWDTDATTWADTVACFRELWARFDVQVVDEDPGNVPHIEAIVGGSPAHVGLPGNVAGVSPFTADCSIIENSIVFTFTDAIPGITSRRVCEITAQEVAHSFGLDHELLASDPMTYLPYRGERAFQDHDASCGEYHARPCGVGGSACRPSQNSVQLLLARVGSGTSSGGDLAGGCSATGGSPLGLAFVVVGLVGLVRLRRRELDRRIVGIGAIQEHDVAEHLRDLALRLRRELGGGGVAIEAGALADLDLDQLVIGERLIHRGDEAVVDPVLADLDDRLHRVCERAEVTPLLAGQHRGRVV